MPYKVSEFIDEFNGVVAAEYSSVEIEGEVAEFKINQGKWVFFSLKDESASVQCFMVLSQLRMPIEDGMKIIVKATPKLTPWGKFSMTVRSMRLLGAGDLKRSFELLKKKLTDEGLFDVARKRPMPENLVKVGVISSTAAAGFIDFVKILNARWGGMEILVAHTAVQGESAPDQIINALEYLNQRTDVQLIAILRGGGSADDLSCFNDEKLVRAVAGSRIPVITGIGHEIDRSLTDFAADIVASTPSNLAEMITHDRMTERRILKQKVARIGQLLREEILTMEHDVSRRKNVISMRIQREVIGFVNDSLLKNQRAILQAKHKIATIFAKAEGDFQRGRAILASYNPEAVLARGYAIVAGETDVGNVVKITTSNKIIQAEVKNVKKR